MRKPRPILAQRPRSSVSEMRRSQQAAHRKLIATHFLVSPKQLATTSIEVMWARPPKLQVLKSCKRTCESLLRGAGQETGPPIPIVEIDGFKSATGPPVRAAGSEAWRWARPSIASRRVRHHDAVVRHSIGRRPRPLPSQSSPADLGGIETMVSFVAFLQPEASTNLPAARPPRVVQPSDSSPRGLEPSKTRASINSIRPRLETFLRARREELVSDLLQHDPGRTTHPTS